MEVDIKNLLTNKNAPVEVVITVEFGNLLNYLKICQCIQERQELYFCQLLVMTVTYLYRLYSNVL